MRVPSRSRDALCLLGLVAMLAWICAGPAAAGQEPGPGSAEAFLRQVDRALGAAQERAGNASPEAQAPIMPAPAAGEGAPARPPAMGSAPRAAAPQGRLGYFELLPGHSTKADVELFLGDPIASQNGQMTYEPPPQATEAERVEATYAGDRRVLSLLDVFLREPTPYGDLAARAGRRVLVERDGAGRVWEYRVPSLLALGYPEGKGGPPLFVDRLRYAHPQYLADLFVGRGQRLGGEGRPEDALVEFEKATRMDPTYASPYLHMGRLLETRGDRARALVHYTAATQAAYPREAKAEAHVAAGRLHHEDGQPELALRVLRRAVAEDPGNAPAHFLTGLTYQNLLKRPQDAVAAYQRAVALKPDYAAAHYNLGLVHLDQTETRAAAEALQRAVEARPDWDKASDRLLSVRLALADFVGAEREARRRLGAAGEDATPMVYLAMALSSQLPERPTLIALLASLVSEEPRLAEALQWLERAVARGYRDVVTLEQNPHLRRVREQAPVAFRAVLAKAAAQARP